MRFHKLLITLSILFLTFQICLGQENTSAQLIDKFGVIGNEHLQERIYAFLQAVRGSKAKGYVITYGSNQDQLSKYLFDRRIKGCFQQGRRETDNRLNWDIDNIFIGLGEDRSEFQVELWQVPDGADTPKFNQAPTDYKLSRLMQPQQIYQLTWVSEYCPLYFSVEFYSKFLKANSHLWGRIIIHERTLNNYQKVKRKYLRELVGKHKISVGQIKFARGKNYSFSDAEFWIVPKTRNKAS